jgi:hypothetical protein
MRPSYRLTRSARQRPRAVVCLREWEPHACAESLQFGCDVVAIVTVGAHERPVRITERLLRQGPLPHVVLQGDLHPVECLHQYLKPCLGVLQLAPVGLRPPFRRDPPPFLPGNATKGCRWQGAISPLGSSWLFDRIGLKYKADIDEFLREEEEFTRAFDRVFGA